MKATAEREVILHPEAPAQLLSENRELRKRVDELERELRKLEHNYEYRMNQQEALFQREYDRLERENSRLREKNEKLQAEIGKVRKSYLRLSQDQQVRDNTLKALKEKVKRLEGQLESRAKGGRLEGLAQSALELVALAATRLSEERQNLDPTSLRRIAETLGAIQGHLERAKRCLNGGEQP